MKKNLLVFLGSLISGISLAQVGINTQAPKSTLDVSAKTTDGTRPEGLLAPRLTGDQIKAGDGQYGNSQTGVLIYATSAVTTASGKTIEITAPGYYYFDGSLWRKLIQSGGAYTGSSSITLNGTSFERSALTGDVTANVNSNATTISDNAVISSKISDGTILNDDISNGVGGIYKGSGSLSANTTVTQGSHSLDFVSTATSGTSHFTIDGTTLNVDAVNNRIGIGNSSPAVTLDIAAKTTDGSQPEGILIPRLSGDQIQLADSKYTTSHKGTIIYATSPVTTPSTKTANILKDGYYVFDGSVWNMLAQINNNIMRKSGASYNTVTSADLTSYSNVLTMTTSAPATGLILNNLTSSDTGKSLYITNLTGLNMDVKYQNDDVNPAQVTMTLQNTRGVTFIWGKNGWLKASY